MGNVDSERETAAGDEGAPDLRILIVCEHASTRFGGEAILPWHYFQHLRERGIDARLIAHERTRAELLALRPQDAARMHFIEDSWLNILAWKLSRFVPDLIANFSIGFISRVCTQLAARRLARRLIGQYGCRLVHQPIPVSPREPSFLFAMGAPVIIGPMNGNMSYPPGFMRRSKTRWVWNAVALARSFSSLLNRLIPGKNRAAALLVANRRTAQALPTGRHAPVISFVENGVDLSLWNPSRRTAQDGATRFVFLGRLVELKGVDLLIDALGSIDAQTPISIDILGDGPVRAALEAQSERLGLSARIRFHGWQPQAECARHLQEADALVLPSYCECGGAVVLEAMACGLPVIATAWGGPLDYLDETCGILVPPVSPAATVAGFAEAMRRLAGDFALRERLGAAGRTRIERDFDWRVKIDRMLGIYADVIAGRNPAAGAADGAA